MSNHFGGSSSRWSSERDRVEREKNLREFDGRRARRSWREGTASTDAATGSSVPEEPADETIRVRAKDADADPVVAVPVVGRKWRDQAPPPPTDGGGLPSLPGDDGGHRRQTGTPVGRWGLVLTAVLFLALIGLAFSPWGPLGPDDTRDMTPTAVPTTVAQRQTSAQGADRSTPSARQTVKSNHLVCIDPGHGGYDTGYTRRQGEGSPAYGPPFITEAELNLGMALMLRDELESRGIAVVMTRETGTASNIFSTDVNGDGRTILDGSTDVERKQNADRDELQNRINICNDAHADVMISVHLNGFDDQSARGYEVVYTKDRDFGKNNEDLAWAVYRQIGSVYDASGFSTQARGVLVDSEQDATTHEYGAEKYMIMTGPGVKNPDYTITPTNMPGVIVEPVFVSNQDDVDWIAQPENQRALMAGYAEGIVTYFEQHP